MKRAIAALIYAVVTVALVAAGITPSPSTPTWIMSPDTGSVSFGTIVAHRPEARLNVDILEPASDAGTLSVASSMLIGGTVATSGAYGSSVAIGNLSPMAPELSIVDVSGHQTTLTNNVLHVGYWQTFDITGPDGFHVKIEGDIAVLGTIFQRAVDAPPFACDASVEGARIIKSAAYSPDAGFLDGGNTTMECTCIHGGASPASEYWLWAGYEFRGSTPYLKQCW